MKKILLIEDRYQRQKLFIDDTNIILDNYSDILDNYTNGREIELLNSILDNSFNFDIYDYIIAHKSAFNEQNIEFLTKLKEYIKDNQKTLILFSGGISINFYDNSEYEILELNSKIFYSQNFKLFLDSIREDRENILMLPYGKSWQFNVVSNIIEKINILIDDYRDKSLLPYGKFSNIISKLDKIDYKFYQIEHKSRISLDEVKKFKDSMLDYFISNDNRDNIETKKLLIHNNNTDIKLFENRIRFTLDSGDIDSYISNEIIKSIKERDFDIIFIKDNLSSNYLELYGLIVAYHIRLSQELGNIKYTPIVIISDLNRDILNNFSTLAKILYTDLVFTIKNSRDEIENFNISSKILDNFDYKSGFLDKIKIEAPKDYLTHHDISNEWAIYRWAEFLKITDSKIVDKNRAKISSMLYFKYLLAKNPIPQNRALGYKRVKNSGKILYIDDEWNRGWSDIFNKYFSNNSNIEFNTFEYNFKDKNSNDIIDSIKIEITKNLPDIILLDLRLTSDDHTSKNIEDFTGIKAIKVIQEINPAIQIIMLSATSKSSILENLYQYGILGYIKKEHPTDININTKDSINKLAKLVDIGFEKSYLKEIWSIQKDILELNLSNEIKFEVQSVFEILNSDMNKRYIYAMLSIHQCLEEINNIFIDDKKSIWIDTQMPINIKNSTKYKILEVLQKRLKLYNFDEPINEITHIRNSIISNYNYFFYILTKR